jgi:hypothetical protein
MPITPVIHILYVKWLLRGYGIEIEIEIETESGLVKSAHLQPLLTFPSLSVSTRYESKSMLGVIVMLMLWLMVLLRLVYVLYALFHDCVLTTMLCSVIYLTYNVVCMLQFLRNVWNMGIQWMSASASTSQYIVDMNISTCSIA